LAKPETGLFRHVQLGCLVLPGRGSLVCTTIAVDELCANKTLSTASPCPMNGLRKNQYALHDWLAVFFAAAWPYFFLGLLMASRILFGG